MNNNNQVTYGLITTIAIFALSAFAGNLIDLNHPFILNSVVTHTLMLLLSMAMIYSFKEKVNYKVSIPKLRTIFKPILFGLLATIVVNVSMAAITGGLDGNQEAHPLLANASPIQVFIFIFIYASIAEELLFRGFLINILKPLKSKGVTILKRTLSLPVIISAVAFGLAHLILFTAGSSGLFILRVVVFTTVIGLIAGYYQEKYDNNAYAIIVHMAGNWFGFVGAVLMQEAI